MTHVPAERCLSIIQLLADSAADMPLGEIAERLNLPKSGAHRLLTTLVEEGWAKKDAQTGFYGLTMRLVILGQRFYVASGIPDICQPLLDQLAAASREFVRLAVVDSNALVWVAQAQGARAGLMYQPSTAAATVPLHATASGKAWLSTLPLDRAIEIVLATGGFENAEAYGPNVMRSVAELIEELAATAARGYGRVMNEAEPGVTALAAVIRSGSTGPVAATVSIAGPSVRMTDARVQDLAPLVTACAAELSDLWPLRLGTDYPPNAERTRGRAPQPGREEGEDGRQRLRAG
ncbi:IclR family transcriptional regulator [Jiella sonneratiae]|uniref:IclR family transcriptional regulator n=1 Tax=Jiella sonneratiae TaxID=2816856 RepID=A0ABS3J9R1_9HYPH|nr:IclR family transcriptional regulator [Jiella sonneratiae]MBO0905875.1 IclR family transcriptional regulator [Jiella sonneratiae]